MAETEVLQAILARLDKINERLDGIEEDTKITRAAVNSILEWVERAAEPIQIEFPVQKAQ